MKISCMPALWRTAGVGLVAWVMAGCAEPQRPYIFTSPPMAREPIDALSAAFEQVRLKAVVVEPQTGIIQTRWEDTGQKGGEIKGHETTVVRRYTATLVRGSFGNEVTITPSALRCVIGDFRLKEHDVDGNCQPLAKLPPAQQAELNRLGTLLEQLMSIP